MNPLFSIVTPCYNRSAFIAEAVESVQAQAGVPFEHLVRDGGSSDGTLAVLARYPHLRVTSRPDRGMYDALNQGIRGARGEIIGLLNSDDRYEPGVFAGVLACFERHPEIVAVSGGAETFRGPFDSRQVLRQNRWVQPQERFERLLFGNPITNAWFFRRDLFEQIGFFDERYRIAADRDFLVRFALSGLPFLPLYQVVYHYRQHAGSYTISAVDSRQSARAETRMAVLREGIQIAETYLSAAPIPPAARPWLRKLHTSRTYRLAATALYHHRWGAALAAAKRGLRYNPLWPLAFLAQGLARILRRPHPDAAWNGEFCMTPIDFDRLPNFFILGAAKSGTTTLNDLLAQHPRVYMSFDKEPMFFSRDQYYARGLDWYAHTFFEKGAGCAVRGEATPHYLFWGQKTAPRLLDAYGQRPVKFVAIFREPAQRAYSWYWNMVKEGREDQPFERALALEEERLRDQDPQLRPYGSMLYGYAKGGMYAAQLEPFLARFPRARFHFLLQEDLFDANFPAAWRDLLAFLEIDPAFVPRPAASNPAALPRSRRLWSAIRGQSTLKGWVKRFLPFELRHNLKTRLLEANSRSVRYPPIDPAAAAALRARFRDQNQRLAEMIGRDLSHWNPA